MKIKEYLKPASIQEAYELCSKGAVIVAGGAFLNLSDREIEQALDLSELGLNDINETNDYVEIGAMATLRDIENSQIIKGNFNGVLSKAAGVIMGVQLRNYATLGGSVYPRYGFSDILTALLALNAEVVLYKTGTISLEDYLETSLDADILLQVRISKNVSKSAFTCMKKSYTDFSVLNAAAAVINGELRLCAGARPARARLAEAAISFLKQNGISAENAEEAAGIAAEELQFASDTRASGEYRQELCKTLVKSCILEVLS